MTVRKRPDSPYWHYDFWYRGRRYKGSTKRTSKARAQEYEAHQRELVKGGCDPHFRSPPLKDLIPQYMDWLEANNKSPAHIDRARRGLKNVLNRMKRVRVAEDIRPKEIDEYKKQRLGECSPFTVNTELRYLRAFLKRCVKQGWLQSMPVEVEQVRTPGRGRLVFLSESEIGPFLDKLKRWAREAAGLALQTGLRLDEARFLEWEDIDLETGELWVRNKPELGFSPKSRKERCVALPPDLIEELAASKRRKGWVLRGPRGGQLSRRRFQEAVAAAGKAAGLAKRITPHVLRHTYGSHLAMSGVDIQTVKDLMGHSSITTTAIYLHTDPKHRREAVAKLKMMPPKAEQEKIIKLRQG